MQSYIVFTKVVKTLDICKFSTNAIHVYDREVQDMF